MVVVNCISREEEVEWIRLGYLLGDKINGGAFSTVHCGLEVKSAEVVAVKVIDLKNISLNFRTHFLPRELANIKRFNHPNIIKVRKISRNEHRIHIVMDYARSNLRAEIDSKTHIGEKQARKWFYQLTSAFQYLQVNGVAHRDIKIDNILVDRSGDIKLCDFGFSKLITPQKNGGGFDIDDRSTTFCGSIAYCAPEILTRTPYDPWKTDVWSLGVVLYKMVIGVMPFGEGNDLASVRKIARAQNKSLEFPPFPRTSPACQNLIRALLTVESAQRISLTQVLQSYDAILVLGQNGHIVGIHGYHEIVREQGRKVVNVKQEEYRCQDRTLWEALAHLPVLAERPVETDFRLTVLEEISQEKDVLIGYTLVQQ